MTKSGKSEYAAMIEGMKEEGNQEIAIAALMAMQNMGDAEVIPIVTKLYNTTRNSEIKEKIIFILSQSDTPEAEDQLIAIAKSDQDTDMREQAVFWIGQRSDSEKGFQTLKTIVLTDPDEDVREKAVFWISQSGNHEKSLKVLQQIMKSDPNENVREKAIFAISQLPASVGVPVLMDIAKNDPSSEIRKKAIFWLGQSNDPRAKETLLEIIQGGE